MIYFEHRHPVTVITFPLLPEPILMAALLSECSSVIFDVLSKVSTLPLLSPWQRTRTLPSFSGWFYKCFACAQSLCVLTLPHNPILFLFLYDDILVHWCCFFKWCSNFLILYARFFATWRAYPLHCDSATCQLIVSAVTRKNSKDVHAELYKSQLY